MRKCILWAAILILSATTIFAADNIIKNGDFSNGMQDWVAVLDSGSFFHVENGVLSADYNGGKNAGIQQKIGSLQPGEEYELSFMSKVDRINGDGFGMIMVTTGEWEPGERITLTAKNTDWKKNSLSFKTKVPFSFVVIRAKIDAAFQIKDLVLAKKDSTQSAAKSVEPTSNLLQNGDFKGGLNNWKPVADPSISYYKVNDGVLTVDYNLGKNAALMQKIGALEPDTEYTLTFSAKVNRIGVGGAFGCIMVTNANWGPAETTSFEAIGDWKDYTVTIKPKVVFDYVVIRAKFDACFQIKNLALKKK